MRLDRAVTLGFAAPLARWQAHDTSAPTRLPILMYHSITPAPDRHALAYHATVTSPERFAAQMQWLADAGWRGLSVTAALLAAAETGNAATPRPVALTFDDGAADFLTHALPVLREHGFSATVYLPTAFIGETRRRFQGTECMTWTEARTVAEAGIELGAHTVTHPRLVDLSEDACWYELVEARREIESHTGIPVREFSYPYAFPSGRPDFVRRLCALLPAAGYAHCVTTMIGRATLPANPLLLPRLPVNEADDRPLLYAKLAGDYDWLGGPQRWLKRLRAAIPAGLSP